MVRKTITWPFAYILCVFKRELGTVLQTKRITCQESHSREREGVKKVKREKERIVRLMWGWRRGKTERSGWVGGFTGMWVLRSWWHKQIKLWWRMCTLLFEFKRQTAVQNTHTSMNAHIHTPPPLCRVYTPHVRS